MELIEQLNEAKERDAGSGLSEKVSDHECARDVRKRARSIAQSARRETMLYESLDPKHNQIPTN